jgi:demethylmenaquinone methyltransferase/2-methoxy-6-polyprenyl-1,4-benzoquinol methylase
MHKQKMKPNMIEYYAKRANEYELVYDRPERQADLIELKKQLKETFRNELVFEVACGTGYWTQIIAETAICVLATDINQSVINIAKAKNYPIGTIDFALADIYSLTDIPAIYTAGFGGFIWSHVLLDSLSPFLATIHSKIKTGGKMVFIDNTYVEGNSTPIKQTDSNGNTYQVRTLKDGTSYLIVKNYPTEAQVRLLLENKAANIEFKKLKYFWYLTYNKL